VPPPLTRHDNPLKNATTPQQVKAELATVANTNAASESLARCNFMPDLEAAINEQIK